jgi:ribonuclease P protein component
MILFFLHEQNISKVGFTASKKVGNAVMRNRAKRRMRALFYENIALLQEGSYVLVAKKELNSVEYRQLVLGLQSACKKMGALRP